ncbi:MAG: hypothetical protein NTW49_14715 [Bacteroidia bacterium]|nr:hypothetical protein [Bacteroidia bacterium]
MSEIRILGLSVFDRIKEAGRTQKILSKYAENIKTRLGFHEVNEDCASRHGFIILELSGDPGKWDLLESELSEIGGLQLKKMSFNI